VVQEKALDVQVRRLAPFQIFFQILMFGQPKSSVRVVLLLSI